MSRLRRIVNNPDRIRVFFQSRVGRYFMRMKHLVVGPKGQDALRIAPVVWLRTPKCASSSILSALEAADRVVNYNKNRDAKLTEDVLRHKIVCISAGAQSKFISDHPDIWDKSFKWAVVRHPYDRAVSAWQYKETLNKLPLDQLLDCPPTASSAPAEYHHFTRSFSSMLTVDGELAVDQVLKFESLDSELPALFEKLGVPFLGLARINETPGKRKKKLDVSEGTREKIQRLYRGDFENFGYVR